MTFRKFFIAIIRDMRSLLASLLLLLVSCNIVSSGNTPTEATHMKPIRYLALGDSYTIGEGVDMESRFPQQLVRRLRGDGLVVQLDVVARTGWTTDELWQEIEDANITQPYDLVTLLIGVNNQYQGDGIEKYSRDFDFLLEKAIGFAGGDPRRVIVISIPDWGVTPFAQERRTLTSQISMEIDKFNKVNRKQTEIAGVQYVNITPISREAEADKTLLAGDGLHPSGRMYSEWIELILPSARLALELEK
jgi:lysophospholipase L1-like esterase